MRLLGLIFLSKHSVPNLPLNFPYLIRVPVPVGTLPHGFWLKSRRVLVVSHMITDNMSRSLPVPVGMGLLMGQDTFWRVVCYVIARNVTVLIH